MDQLAGGPLPAAYSPLSKNLKASPYSILRKSDELDVADSIQTMQTLAVQANHGGQRTTRTEIYRQLALKNKIKDNPQLNKKVKVTKYVAD